MQHKHPALRLLGKLLAILEFAQQDKHMELVRACKQGDRISQYKLYKAYAKAMYNTSLRILRDQLHAEDVVQEAFIEVFTRLDRFREDSSFGYWVKQIVVNKSISALRKIKGDLLIHTEEIPDTAFQSEEDGETEAMRHTEWEVKRIKTAIHQLPDGYRMVLILYLLEGYDHEEIAQILSISQATSRTQFFRGRKRLLEILNAN